MKTAYVIFRIDGHGKEVYVDALQETRNVVESTDERRDAKEFDFAREAYDWAGARHLDNWKVGAR